MGRLLIVNGSPRALRSHSKQIAELFQTFWGGEVSQYNVTAKKHAGICEQIGTYTDLLFVFPLYVDGLPVTLMHFLKEMENHPVSPKPVVHLIINCGFLEPEQNRVACDMVRLFCKQNGYPFGSSLWIGSGEAILETPFAYFVKRKLKKMATSITTGKPVQQMVTMPLPKRTFLKESTKYWIRYGEKNGVTKQQMEMMEIESVGI